MSNNTKPNKISDGLYFSAILFKHKTFIIIMTIIAAIASVIISLILPVWYAATVSFVPPIESGGASSSSGLSSIMKDFGMEKIGGKSDKYDMIVFLNSRSVADSMIKKYDLVKRYNMENLYYEDVRKEFWGNIEVAYLKEGNYEVTVWDKDNVLAAEMANDYVNIANHFIEKTKNDDLRASIEYLSSRIASIDSTIQIISKELWELSKDKSMFSPEDQAKAAATTLSTIKANELEYGILYDFLLKMFGEDDPQTQNAKALLMTAKKGVEDAFSKPGLVGNFALKDVTPIAVNYLTKYADIEALTKTKAVITTSLEKANLDYHTNHKNFFIVDRAEPSDKKDKPKRFFICAGGTFGGFMLSILIILILNGIKIASKQAKLLEIEEKEEIEKFNKIES